MKGGQTRTCAWCGQDFQVRTRPGTPFANFCSGACVTAHKVRLGELHASQLELDFAEALRDAGLAVVAQFALGPYVVDLACPQARLLIEVDGEAFHSSRKAAARDDRKDALAAREGWRLVRVPQFMVREHLDEAVRAVIEAYFAPGPT